MSFRPRSSLFDLGAGQSSDVSILTTKLIKKPEKTLAAFKSILTTVVP